MIQEAPRIAFVRRGLTAYLRNIFSVLDRDARVAPAISQERDTMRGVFDLAALQLVNDRVLLANDKRERIRRDDFGVLQCRGYVRAEF